MTDHAPPRDDLERARDPSTVPRDLERFAVHRADAVRAAVAGNPNASSRVLERLSVRHSSQVLRNPVVELLILENPNWFDDLPEFARVAFLRDASCPNAWLERVVARGFDAKLWGVVAQNPACPKRLLEAMRSEESVAAALHVAFADDDQDQDLRTLASTAAAHLERDVDALKDALAVRLIPAWLLEVIAQIDDLEVRLAVIRQPGLNPATLERLAFSDDEDVRRAARARDLPEELRDFLERAESGVGLREGDLERLMQSAHGRWLVARHARAAMPWLENLGAADDWRVRQAVASNSHASTATLSKLARDLDKDVRAAIAANTAAPKSALARLMLDANDEVRAAARLNPSAPEVLRHTLDELEGNDPRLSSDALERLARRDDTLAAMAAAHVNASPELLRSLGSHDDWKVRYAVARHERVPGDTLERLGTDADFDVRGAVAINAAAPTKLLARLERDPHPLVRSGVALNANTLPPTLERLMSDEDADVRSAVAVHPLSSSELLDRLSRDPAERVRRAVALHTRTSAATLERLSADDDAEVRSVVADHPMATLACSEGLFGARFDWRDLYARVISGGDVRESELRFLAGLNDFARTLALQSPRCPADLLEGFAASDDWRVRQRVAAHPRTPITLLEALSQDSDYDVREAVARHADAPLSAVTRLARDDHGQVRKAVAERADLNAELGDVLGWDEDEDVLKALAAGAASVVALREHATRGDALNATERAQLREVGTPLALRLLASNPATTLEELLDLRDHDDWRVRLEIARHPNTDAETLEVLLCDADADVRRAVASNPATSSALLERLLHDQDVTVRRATLEHPNLEPSVAQSQRRAILTRLLVTPGLTRVIALEHPDVPTSEFRKHRNLHAASFLERLALTRNPRIPTAALEVLARDANRLVRREALAALQARGAS
jgi:hypothetical protein